jgi:hypothetical protein
MKLNFLFFSNILVIDAEWNYSFILKFESKCAPVALHIMEICMHFSICRVYFLIALYIPAEAL